MLSKYVPSGIKVFAETVSYVTTSGLPVSEGGLLNTAHHQEYLQLMDWVCEGGTVEDDSPTTSPTSS